MTQPAEPIREQRSVFYFSRRDELPKPYTDFYVQMFLDDISRRMVPIRDRGREIELEGGDSRSEALIQHAVSWRDYSSSFDWGVSEFLRLATSEICAFDEAIFEIAYLRNAQSRELEGFLFFHIDPRQLSWKWGKLFQIVPEEEARKRQVGTEIHLPLEDTLIFALPKKLRCQVARLRSALTRLSEVRLAGHALQLSNTVPNYDFRDHERSLNLALAQACAEIGWDARGSYRDKTLGYLQMDSFLRFEQFQIEVRKVVFDLFNQALDRVRLQLPLKGRVSPASAPDSPFVQKAREDLQAGRDSFVRIMDRFRG